MSFKQLPVTKALVLGSVAASILASVFDTKHYLYILADVHIWRYRQFWRFLTYQLCYTNSAEVLFGAMTLYNVRVVERMWGSRKFASFLVVTYIFTSLIPPLLMLALRPLTLNLTNYIPAGPTPLIFALLAQYHAMIPHMYKYRIATSAAPPTDDPFTGVTLSDKSYRYALALHLSLLQWPGSLVGALTGWVVGHAYREGILPPVAVRWRLPGWMLGIKTSDRSRELENMRRRLEGEGEATATGAQGREQAGQTERRRPMAQQFLQQFREAL